MKSILEHFPLEGKKPYAHQRDVLLALEEGLEAPKEKKFMVLRGPTGCGKSAVAISLAQKVRESGGQVHILASHRFLQDQYVEDFKSLGLSSLWGKANYSCTTAVKRGNPRRDCSRCLADEEPTPSDRLSFIRDNCSSRAKERYDGDQCLYIQAKREAVNSSLSLNNYASFLTHANLAGTFDKRDLLIVDEAHLVESRVSDFVSVNIRLGEHLEKWHVKEILSLTDPSVTDLSQYLEELLLPKLIGKSAYLFSKLGILVEGSGAGLDKSLVSLREDNPSLLVEADKPVEISDDTKTRLIKIGCLIDNLRWLIASVKESPKNWVYYLEKGRVTFKPVVAGSLAHKYLFSFGGRVLLMSATVDTGPFLRDLGIRGRDIACFLDVPSTFELENRPLIAEFCGSLSRKSLEKTLPKAAKIIEGILERHGRNKGIIHTHSFSNAAALKELMSPGAAARFIWHERDDDLDHLLEKFFASQDSWLVSPSVTEGLNGIDDRVRVQVLLKTPYASLGDSKVNARRALRDGDTWYNLKAAQTLVQAYGRGCRHKEDWCSTYILDSNAARAISKSSKYLPAWFMQAWGNSFVGKWKWDAGRWKLRA